MRRRCLPIFLGALLVVAPAPGRAVVFTVNGIADAVDVSPGDGVCATANGICSLRAAIQEANARPGGDTVSLPAGTYRLGLDGRNEENAATGDLDLRDVVEVAGAGAGATIVDADGIDRAFDAWVSASLRGLTIRGGDATANAGGFRDGGGILVLPETGSASVDVADVRISGNAASGGGGIFVGTGSQLNLTRASVTGNTAISGGGIEVASDAEAVRLTNVTVSANVADVDGGLRVLRDAELLHVTLADNPLAATDGVTIAMAASVVGSGAFCTGLGTVVSGGFNVEAGASCALAGTGDASATDPQLGALADHGGGTLTHALVEGSPAVDRVTGTCGVADDQRGVSRPVDGDGDAVARCDAGAYELDTSTGCSGVSLAALGCRLDALHAELLSAGVPGAPLDTTLSRLVRAAQKLAAVQPALDEGKAGKAKKQVKKAAALVKKVGKRLASETKGPKVVASDASRAALSAAATTLATDLLAYRETL